MSPDTQLQIAEWRQRSLAGTMTIDDYRQAIAYLRQDRRASSEAVAKSKTSKKKAPVDGQALLDELEGL